MYGEHAAKEIHCPAVDEEAKIGLVLLHIAAAAAVGFPSLQHVALWTGSIQPNTAS